MLIRGRGFLICGAGEGQTEEILSVYRRCEDFLSLGPEPHASMSMVLEDLRHSRDEGGVFCGVYASGEMAGVVDFVPDGFEGRAGQQSRWHRVLGWDGVCDCGRAGADA